MSRFLLTLAKVEAQLSTDNNMLILFDIALLGTETVDPHGSDSKWHKENTFL